MAQASLSARMCWVVTAAQQLALLDDDALIMWMDGVFDDIEILNIIFAHGAFRETLNYPNPTIRATAHKLRSMLCELTREILCAKRR